MKLDGLFPIWKSAGRTSFQCCDEIRRILAGATGLRRRSIRVGHGGTLDPDATGVLVIGVGAGCRRLQSLLKGTKEYEAVGKMGQRTDTLDSSGVVTEEKPFDHVTAELLAATMASQFTGQLRQIPPMYSAKHYAPAGSERSVRLHQLARAGKTVQREPNDVVVHGIELLAFDPPTFSLRVESGGGFYVRSLIDDLCVSVGSVGHMAKLVRTRHGPFDDGEREWANPNFLLAACGTP